LRLNPAIFAFAVVLALPGAVRAVDCPVETQVQGTLEAKEQAIRKAPTCKRAYEIMEACAYTASGDTGLGEALRERCEPEFLLKVSKAQRRIYAAEQKRCSNKYAHESGTMYVSFAAFCRAESTVKYAARYGVPAKPKNETLRPPSLRAARP
jgi:hypothetical protein